MIVFTNVSKSNKKGEAMNTKPENEIIYSDEINLYDYWKILVKRKKIFLGIFLIPLVIAIIISLIMPRYYKGESEISIPAPVPNIPSVITASNIVNPELVA